MPGGGTSTGTQTTQTQSKTQPWKPTIGPLTDIIGGINGQIPNYKPTAAENSALDTIMANAKAGNPFTGQISSLANDLFTGGTDRTGMVSDAYSTYKSGLDPYLSADYLDPGKNPYFNSYTSQLADNAANRVNSQFAAAGRDMSGANMTALGKGITEATLPVFAQQYNQNVATQRGAQEGLLSGAGSTAGILSGLDQTALGNRAQGVGAAAEALGAQNSGANSILQAEAMRRGLPLGNLGQLSSLLLPIAGLGSQSSGTSTSNVSQTMSPAQQALMWSQFAKNGVGTLGTIFG